MARPQNGPGGGPDDRTLMTRAPDFTTGVGDSAPYLSIIHPRDAMLSFPLTEEGLLLGRGMDSDVQLPATMISRRHCRVSCVGRRVLVEDLDSTNGTIIDGERIKRAYLPPDSRLKVGPFVLKLEYKGTVELRAQNQLLEAARQDALTGVPNRGWLIRQAARLLAELSAPESWLSTVMVDIDRFKYINDRWGHAAGDTVLRGVAQVLQQQMRERDLLGRFGGEEFVMILPHTDRQDALIFCDRIRENVAQASFDHEGIILSVNVSIGVTSKQHSEIVSLDSLIGEADAAMYRAKQGGRNRVCF